MSKLIIKKTKIDLLQAATILFVVKLALQFCSFVSNTTTLDNLVGCAACICLLLYMLNMRFTTRMLLVYLFACIFTFLTCYVAKNFSLMITVAMVFALRGYDFKRFIKTLFVALTIVLIIFCLCSVLYSVLFSSDRFVSTTELRWRFNFGFKHANVFSLFLFCDLLMYVWLNYNRLTFLRLFIVVIIEGVSFLLTNSRTPLVLMLVFVVFAFLDTSCFGKKILKTTTALIIPILSIVIYLFVANYFEWLPITERVNSFLNSRIKLGGFAFSKLGISLLGQYVPFRENMEIDPTWGLTSFTFDNIYTNFLINLGWIWLLILSFAFFKISKVLKPSDCAFLLVWAIYGLTEDIILNGFSCFPIFFTMFIFESQPAYEQSYLNKSKTAI